MRNHAEHRCNTRRLHNQHGVAAVEFALIAGLLFTLMFGIFEMGRVFFYMNTAAEVTSIGARMAVVCDMNDADIKAKMRAMLPIITADSQINISYIPAGCNVGTCTSVTVAIAQNTVPITTSIPYVPIPTFYLPTFPTSLRRESMNSTNNPVCI